MDTDLFIYYSGNHYVSGMCSRWDCDSYSLVVELYLKKEPFNTLYENIRPGACKELYKILGRPKFVDTSWTGKNTLRLYPLAGVNKSKLPKMRNPVNVYVKSFSGIPVKGPSGFINTKIEAYTSSSTL